MSWKMKHHLNYCRGKCAWLARELHQFQKTRKGQPGFSCRFTWSDVQQSVSITAFEISQLVNNSGPICVQGALLRSHKKCCIYLHSWPLCSNCWSSGPLSRASEFWAFTDLHVQVVPTQVQMDPIGVCLGGKRRCVAASSGRVAGMGGAWRGQGVLGGGLHMLISLCWINTSLKRMQIPAAVNTLRSCLAAKIHPEGLSFWTAVKQRLQQPPTPPHFHIIDRY